jgi:3-phosphoshikimate 1-carboxyvinyltransferase
MPKSLIIKKKIKKFKKIISVDGDKSISIRWVLFSSLAKGISIAKNLLVSEDVMAAIRAIKVLGIKSKLKKK